MQQAQGELPIRRRVAGADGAVDASSGSKPAEPSRTARRTARGARVEGSNGFVEEHWGFTL